MRLLLDTHAFIWALGMVEKLPRPVIDLLSDPNIERWISAVSAYEIEYKRERNEVLDRLPHDLQAAAKGLNAEWLDVTPIHAGAAARLDRVHRDPWDRIIAAQSIEEGLVVVTRDPAIASMGASVVWR